MPFIGHRSRTLARAKSLALVAAEKSSSERALRCSRDVPFGLISSRQPTTNQVVNQTFSPCVLGKKATDG